MSPIFKCLSLTTLHKHLPLLKCHTSIHDSSISQLSITMLTQNPTPRIIFLLVLLSAFTISISTRPGSAKPFSPKPRDSKGSSTTPPSGTGGGFFGPGFDIPGLGNGWGNGIVGGGYGSGYGSPSGGRSKNGIFRSSVVCKEKGPCYKKKLICPAKCFTSYSRSGKNYGGGGGGGGCTVDCSKKCIAYC